ncbi:hypothetical protein CANCADRAFT_931 [Tortispora caseinolytica NRRL Y-17796]|uniref:Ribosome biogenesis protein SLX9 n=1 Tax=Tortispora caseinolytica NRRL Y-17796 TaxID=767744 RepID=A0A1E4TKQ9_9ASCO|nr:hypothetical protein CANCADRAFT_931 [Tortispora caseinolytica NRRL Y-17796]
MIRDKRVKDAGISKSSLRRRKRKARDKIPLDELKSALDEIPTFTADATQSKGKNVHVSKSERKTNERKAFRELTKSKMTLDQIKQRVVDRLSEERECAKP